MPKKHRGCAPFHIVTFATGKNPGIYQNNYPRAAAQVSGVSGAVHRSAESLAGAIEVWQLAHKGAPIPLFVNDDPPIFISPNGDRLALSPPPLLALTAPPPRRSPRLSPRRPASPSPSPARKRARGPAPLDLAPQAPPAPSQPAAGPPAPSLLRRLIQRLF